MPQTYYDGGFITGVASVTTYGDDIVSTSEEPKIIKSLFCSVEVHDDGAYVIVKQDRDEIVRIPVNLLPVSITSGAANIFPTTQQLIEIPLDIDLPQDSVLKVGIENDPTTVDLSYAYSYEIKG